MRRALALLLTLITLPVWAAQVGPLQSNNNLADLPNPAAARSNLGLAPSATTDTTNASNITTGTLPPAQLPTPTTGTLGGVKAAAGVSHQWVYGISTAGLPLLSQPAAADISGLGTAATWNVGTSGATLPLLNGVNTWAGMQTFSGGVTNSGAETISGTLGVNGLATLGVGSGGTGNGLVVNNQAVIGSGNSTGTVLTLGNSTLTTAVMLQFNGATGQNRPIRWQTAGVNRWQLAFSGAETGSNVGGNLVLNGFSDAGTNNTLGPTFIRATGGFDLSQAYVYAGDTANTLNTEMTKFTQNVSGVQNMSIAPVYNSWAINDSVAEQTITGSTNIGISFLHNLNAGYSGSRFGVAFVIDENASPLGSFGATQGTFLTAINSLARSSVSAGGVNNGLTGSRGSLQGSNFTVHYQTGATNRFAMTASEFDCTMDTGTSAALRYCVSIANLQGDSTVRARVDAGLNIYGASNPFQNALLFGGSQGLPIPANGTLIRFIRSNAASGTPTAGRYGVELSDLAVGAFNTTQDTAVFRSRKWAVSGTGEVREGPCYNGSTNAGGYYDCKGSIGDAATPPAIANAGVGDNYQPLELFEDPFGGLIVITAATLKSAVIGVDGGGTGGTNGACTVTGTSGAGGGGTLFQVSGTVVGGVLTAPLTVAVAGNYVTPVPVPENEPVNGCGLVGATVGVDMIPTAIAWVTDANGNTQTGEYPSLTPPSNPLATAAHAGSLGVGMTINKTWITNATAYAIQASGGATTIGGSLTLSSLGSGTATKYLCVTSGNVVIAQVSPC